MAELWREFPQLEYPARQKKIKGEIGEALACHSLEQQRSFLLVGAGRPGHLADARRLACKTMALLHDHHVARALIYFTAPLPYPPAYLRNLVDYLHLNNYRFDRYRKKKGKPVERIELVFKKRVAWSGREWPARAIVLEEAELARDLVNEIPAKADPDAMVQAFGAGVRRHGLKLDIWRRKELESQRHERPARRRRILVPRAGTAFPDP